MKKSNLRNFQAYRMYQAPEGGAENAVRTSYLKDLSEASTGRGGGGTPRHPQCQGQKLSGQNMSVTNTVTVLRLEHSRGQHRLSRMTVNQGAGSCPVVDTFNAPSQKPSDSRSIAKPASVTTASQFEIVRCGR